MYHLETQSLWVHYRPGQPMYSTFAPKPPGDSGKGKKPDGGPPAKASKLNDGGRLTKGKEKANDASVSRHPFGL